MSKTLTDKQYEDMKNIMDIQGSHGNWNYDPYMHGMYNGLEMMMAIVDDRDPVFKQAPEQWLDQSPETLLNSDGTDLAGGSDVQSE